MGGLLRYLVGKGRANEHRDPHVIAGDGFVKAWHGAEMLDQRAAAELAGYLDQPRLQYGTEIRTRRWRQDPDTGKRVSELDADGQQVWRDQHVWHCALSLPPGEVLSGEKWDAVASDYMDRMGFTGSDGKAPARWVAIHHGPSKNGNDHIHIAASMVREDGTRWAGGFLDYVSAQKACRELEASHGLTPVDGRQHGTAVQASKPAERAAAEKARLDRTPREHLAERIRSTAVASTSEAEWLRRVQDSGVVVRPYFAKGTTDVVAGYRAALKTGGTDELHFYGGGTIGRDLALPRLRESWPEPTLEAAGEAAREWQAAAHGRRTGVAGRESKPAGIRDSQTAAQGLAALTDRLARTPVTDRTAWANAARDTSAALAAAQRLFPHEAAELRQAAESLSRTAQERRAGSGTRPDGQAGLSPMGTAYIFLAAAKGSSTKVAAAMLMTQLLATATAIRDYHRAAGHHREADLVQHQVVDQVQTISARYAPLVATGPGPKDRSTPASRRAALLNSKDQTGRESPLPNKLTARDHVTSRTSRKGTDRGRE